jgi:acetyl-CoA acetyltransferase
LALHGACKDIWSEQAELSLAIGVEKMYRPEAADRMKSFAEGTCKDDMPRLMAVYEEVAREAGRPFTLGQPGHSMFMDTYAMQACWHMWKWGTTQRQIAAAAAKNHHHGSLNPKAQYRFEVPLDKVLADYEVSYPLTRSMCAPIGDGAAAALVCSERFLTGLPPAIRGRAVRVKASVLSNGKYRPIGEPGLSRWAAERAYRLAGVTPDQIDVAEVNDATSFCEIHQAEMIGFCPAGQGGAFVECGATALGGKLPINTSGGLVSKGHPIGATGLSMVEEIVLQLRGEAGPRQVPGARLGLVENGGGVIGVEEAVCAVTILGK